MTDRPPLADQAATLYRAGHSTTCVADQIGRGWTSTRELLETAGVTFRRRGTRCRPELHPRTARLEYAARLRTRYEAGATTTQLATETGLSPSWVTTLLHHAGTRMRPAGRPRNTSS